MGLGNDIQIGDVWDQRFHHHPVYHHPHHLHRIHHRPVYSHRVGWVEMFNRIGDSGDWKSNTPDIPGNKVSPSGGIIPLTPGNYTGPNQQKSLDNGRVRIPSDPTAVKNVFSDLYSVANWLHNALLSALGDPAATFAVYQSYHETDRWSSNLWVKHNNGSGITYAKQKGAYIVQVGLRKFAGFKTKEDWLAAYIHELTKKANPAGAKTLEDYVSRLKKNGYFEESESSYFDALVRARYALRNMPGIKEWDPTDQVDPKTGKVIVKDSWFKLHPILTGIGIGVGVLTVIKVLKS